MDPMDSSSRPGKRRRLTTALVSSVEYDGDDGEALERDRYANDMRLKGRFEDIFAKYSRDFSGIGDEIDLATGKIVVDNGHLASMCHDRDVGPAQAQLFLNSFADKLAGGSINAIEVDGGERHSRSTGHGHVDSTEQEHDNVRSLLGPSSDRPDDGAAEEQIEGCHHTQLVQHAALSPKPHSVPLPSANNAALHALSQSITAQIAQFLGQWQQPQAPVIDPLWAAPPLPLQPRAHTRFSQTTRDLSVPSSVSAPIPEAAQVPFRDDPQATSIGPYEQHSVWASPRPRRSYDMTNRRARSVFKQHAEPAGLEEASASVPVMSDPPDDSRPFEDRDVDSPGSVSHVKERRRIQVPPFSSQEINLLLKLKTVEKRRWDDIAKYFPTRKKFHLVSNYHSWIKDLGAEDFGNEETQSRHSASPNIDLHERSHQTIVRATPRRSKPSTHQGTLIRDRLAPGEEDTEGQNRAVPIAGTPEDHLNHSLEQAYTYSDTNEDDGIGSEYVAAQDSEPQTIREIPYSQDGVEQSTPAASSESNRCSPEPTITGSGFFVAQSPTLVSVQIPSRKNQQTLKAPQRSVPSGDGGNSVAQSRGLHSTADELSKSTPACVGPRHGHTQTVQGTREERSAGTRCQNSTEDNLPEASSPAPKSSKQTGKPHPAVRPHPAHQHSNTYHRYEEPDDLVSAGASQYLSLTPTVGKSFPPLEALSPHQNANGAASMKASQPSSSPVLVSASKPSSRVSHRGLHRVRSTATVQPASTPRRHHSGRRPHLSSPKSAPTVKPLPATPVTNGFLRKRLAERMDDLEDLPPSAKKARPNKLLRTPKKLVDLVWDAESEDELGL
ncbi:hypothetical protein H2199_001394 [Coniosporium tulheliwenetii]|uniref:Uncharacterized protein n=1 Tax=Coniosporium tulheliwenetii TaxID=3383036 RepID=A0ACC2ZLW3_9PEZI|nr:hypothetical protein H2199_001394 [Cladosporium sp. JES 115]